MEEMKKAPASGGGGGGGGGLSAYVESARHVFGGPGGPNYEMVGDVLMKKNRNGSMMRENKTFKEDDKVIAADDSGSRYEYIKTSNGKWRKGARQP